MFETAEVGHVIDKDAYAAEVPLLRSALLDAQFDLKQARKFATIIVIGGVDGAGKGETVNLLSEWMDPRHIETHAFGVPTDEELARPDKWRFWRALPPRGKIGILFGSWYTEPIVQHAAGDTTEQDFDSQIERINRFERMLADEGVLLLKFWFHLSKKVQKRRLSKLEDNPRTRWRVTEQDWKNFKKYEQFRNVSAKTVRETDMAYAPWIIVEGEDARYRSLTVGKTLVTALRGRIDNPPTKPTALAHTTLRPIDSRNILDTLDLTTRTEKAEYETKLEELQGRLALAVRHPRFRKLSVVAVFEGSDAAGKGGAIRRVTAALDARFYQVVPVAAPTEEERLQPYLWRFWRQLPARGRTVIFDRSWYGRVLVERVEGFCSESDWLRAYSEINDFEEQMHDHQVVVCKFWLQVSKEEQLRRFTERQESEFKRFKITDEDWRNREKWDQYIDAICDMVDRTSTEIAPWTLVGAEDKHNARLVVLETLCNRIEGALKKRKGK
ncbi:MAG: polyphosphate:AMP phosphotransferase [Myxococcales bacterium]|nr:polyphosphate:AMP phosphotransferase [Myxococcales bacterium]